MTWRITVPSILVFENLHQDYKMNGSDTIYAKQKLTNASNINGQRLFSFEFVRERLTCCGIMNAGGGG
jgi:hypothetical protein